MSWYLRSYADHDTHRGLMTAGGVAVAALCGIRFEPISWSPGGKALSGQPPDPGQVCPEWPARGEPVSRPVPWVPALDHPGGVLQAWCGAPVEVAASPGEASPAPECPHCALIFLVEAGGPRFGRPGGGPR